MLSLVSRWPGDAAGVVDRQSHAEEPSPYEYQVLVRLADILPADVRVRIVADRGFGDQTLYRVLIEELKFDFVIRFRGNRGDRRRWSRIGSALEAANAARRRGHRRRRSRGVGCPPTPPREMFPAPRSLLQRQLISAFAVG